MTLFRNRDLNLYSRVGEARAEFEARCERAAEDLADEDASSLRDKYERKLDRLKERHDAAQRRAEEIEVDVEGAKRTEWTDLAGTVIDFLSGRRSTRRVGSTARRRASVRSKQQRLRSAKEKADDLAEAMEELDAELDEELDDISDLWDEKARAIEEMEIGLESDDIDVAEIFVAWMPA